MKITKIKNEKLKKIIINSTDDNIQFEVSPESLLDLGWVFEDAIDYIAESKNISEEEAEIIFEEENIIYLQIIKINDTEIHTTYEINNIDDHFSNISNGESVDTGDDEETINDIIKLDLF